MKAALNTIQRENRVRKESNKVVGGEIDKKNENTSSTPPSLSSDELVTLLDDFFLLWPALSTSCYFCAPSLSLFTLSLCVGVVTRNKVSVPLSGKIFQ